MAEKTTKAEVALAGAKARKAVRLLLAIVESERQCELDSYSTPGHEKDPPPYPTVSCRHALESIQKMDKAIKAGRDALAAL